MLKKPSIYLKKRLAIGVSGSGTTFEAIAKAVYTKDLDMEISFVFSDRGCKALKKAKILGIKIVQREEGEELNKFHERIIELLKENKVDIVTLAGYLRLFPIGDSDPYLVLNSHPGAIPYFGGEGMWGHFVHEAVILWAKKTDFKYPYTFSTVHIASCEYDEGPVLGIKRCEIKGDDTVDTLAARLLPIEHQNYIEVLKNISKGKIREISYPKKFLDLTS